MFPESEPAMFYSSFPPLAAYAAPGVSRAGRADTRLTASRLESKYLLSTSRTADWASLLDRQLPRSEPPAGELAPCGHQYQTSVYFDTARRDLFVAARAEHPMIQVRIREYHPGPMPDRAAAAVEAALSSAGLLWLELKSKSGLRVEKRRFSLSRAAAEGAIERLGRGLTLSAWPASEGDAHPGREALAQLCSPSTEPLRPDCVVNYVRQAWQNAEGTLRITLDREVAFFEPVADMWRVPSGLKRQALGRARMVLTDAVLEIKSRGRRPGWLQQRIAGSELSSVSFSKFLAGSNAVHTQTAATAP